MPIVVSQFLGALFPLRQPHHCLCGEHLTLRLHLSVCHFRAPQHLHDMLVNRVTALARDAGYQTSNAHSLQHLNLDSNIVPGFRLRSSFPAEPDIICDFQLRNPVPPLLLTVYAILFQ